VTTVIELRRNALIDDIENYAFVTGDIMNAADEHAKHQVFDIAQDGNEDLVTRVLNLSHAECVEMLYPYTKTECVDHERLDDSFEAPEVYEITMTLPTGFSHSTVLLLRGLIHDYLVCRVLMEWLGVTCPTAQPYWKERLEELKSKLKTALLGRRKPLRLGQSMF
jgi:hypothetical protein